MVRSAPPENAFLPDAITQPLIAAVAATCSITVASSSITLPSMTFIDLPGMSQVSSATPAASVSRRKFFRCMGWPRFGEMVQARSTGRIKPAR